MSQYSKEFILFVSTIAGEAANSSSASWKAIAHVIMNRFKYKEWRRHQTINDIILKTGFDAAKQKNQPFLSAYNSLSAGEPSPLVLRIIAAVRPIYDGMIKDPTGKVVLYYSPKAQSSLSRSKPHSYKPTPAWNFNLLEEVKISGTENDDFKWYRYKNANRSKRLQIVNLDGQAIPDVPYEITHNKQGQEKVIVQGKTDQEGKTKEIPYQHAGKDVKVKINPNADKHMPKANIEGMISVTEIITKLISPYVKQRVILKPNGKPGNYAGMYYRVKKGDTLTKIAQNLGTTVEALLHANPKITDPNKIYIGQKIRLPAKTGRPVARKENGEVKIDRPTKPRETNTQPPAEKVQTKPTVNTGANTQTGNREVQIEKPKAQESGNQPSARKVQTSPSSATGTASRPKEDNGAKHTSPQLRQRREVKRVNSVNGKPVTVVKEENQDLIIIKIIRKWETQQSTISEYAINNSNIKGYILERPGPDTLRSNMRLRIPEGTYNVVWHNSPRFGRQLLNLFNNQVSKGRKILIHHGNFPKDTDGCLLVGSTKAENFVGGSRPKLNELNSYIKRHNINRVRVVIQNDFEK